MIEAYIISAIAILLAYFAKYDRMKNALPLAFIIITIFLSLGYEWGNDVPTYFKRFEDYKQSSLFDFGNYDELNIKSEFGWVFINQLFAPLGFYGMRAVLFAFENFVIYLLIKRVVPKEYYWFAVFIYTMNPNFMVLSSSMMRQWLAMCLVVLGFLFLEKKKLGTYIILILIAASIHKSSLICLPLVLIPRLMDNFKSVKIPIWVFGFLIYFLLSGALVNYVTGWLQTEDIYTSYTDADSVGIFSLVQLTIYVFMFAHIQQIEKSKRLYIIVLMGFAMILPLYYYSALASRLTFYFIVFTIAAYPLFLSQSKVNNLVKYAFIAAIVGLTLFSYVSFFAHPTWFRYYSRYTTLMEAGILNF